MKFISTHLSAMRDKLGMIPDGLQVCQPLLANCGERTWFPVVPASSRSAPPTATDLFNRQVQCLRVVGVRENGKGKTELFLANLCLGTLHLHRQGRLRPTASVIPVRPPSPKP